MGRLYYAKDDSPLEFDDRLLAHLKVVIITKLRRHEAFTLSRPIPDHAGRETFWLSPEIPLRFQFDALEAPPLDHDLLERLSTVASMTGGIVLDDSTGRDTD